MKRKALALGLFLGAVAVGAAAFAWYAGQGSGNGAVAKGGNAPLALTVSIPADQVAAIFPGDADPIAFQVSNDGTHNAHVGGIALDTSYGTGGISTSDPSCLPSWFTFTGLSFVDPLPASQVLAPGSGYGATGTLTFVDAPVDQSACSGVSVSVGIKTTP